MSDVNYVSREGLVEKGHVKYEVKYEGVTAFLRTTLNRIPVGKAVTLISLRNTVMTQYPGMTKDIAYDKIHFTMTGRLCEGFKKMTDPQGVTYVARLK